MIFKEIIQRGLTDKQMINPNIRDNAVFFDIETTGLSKIHSNIFLCGVLYYENSNYVVEQFFDDTSTSEKNLITFISTHFMKKQYIITYNGNAFDIPFYETKCKKYDINSNLDNKTLIDLYLEIKKTGFSKNLDNLKLKTIEKFMNINRKDQLGGEDLIRLNNSYKLTPKAEYLDLMLGHNFEDVISLPYVFSYINKHITKKSIILAKPSYNKLHLIEKSIQTKRNSIKFSLTCLPVFDYDLIVNALFYKLLWAKRSAKIEFELLVNEGFNNEDVYVKFINLKNYGLSKYDKYLVLEKNYSVHDKNLLTISKLLLETYSNDYNKTILP